jgi:hypothetical protein
VSIDFTEAPQTLNIVYGASFRFLLH